MMKGLLCGSVFFGVLVSLLAYECGMLLRRKSRLAVFNPLLLSIALVMGLLRILHVGYASYYEGAKYLSYLLTPATICLAVPLYERIALLKQNLRAILAGVLSGVLTSLLCILGFAVLFRFTHEEYVTLLPKSITTAIGMDLSRELGGMATITTAAILVTGVLGNMVAETVLKLFRIEEPVAKGVAIGSAAHAIGTAKAMELGEVEGAMSSLSIVVAGLMTVAGASVFAGFW